MMICDGEAPTEQEIGTLFPALEHDVPTCAHVSGPAPAKTVQVFETLQPRWVAPPETVSGISRAWLMPTLWPITRTVYAPVRVAFEIVSVNVDACVGMMAAGAKEAVTPAGRFEALSETAPEKPFRGFTVI
jgi:hypothetical protein